MSGPAGISGATLQPIGTGAYLGAEVAVDLIQSQIRTYIATALQNVRTARADPSVTTEPPHEYFNYPTAEVYRAPAIFTIIQGMDIRNDVKNANFIAALDEIVVAAVVEDRVKRLVVPKAWRYQAALMQLLHLVTLTTSDGKLRLFSRVQKCTFSGIINLTADQATGAVFRQEMSLQLQVEHMENLR